MACRGCGAAGVVAGTAGRAWLWAVAGWIRRLVPFGPVRRPTPALPAAGHPESLAADLPAGQEALLAAPGGELFPDA